MTDWEADAALRHEISVAMGKVSYFHNIAAVSPGICRVCRGPAQDSDACPRCQSTAETLGGATCDHTFFVAYADGRNPGGWSQSAQTMRLYKEIPPTALCVEHLHELMFVVTWIHDDCMRVADGGWDAAAFVPSRTPREGLHPVAAIARNVARLAEDDPATEGPHKIKRVVLEPGPVDVSRIANAGRFAVSDMWRPSVEGKRVLLVDDTWTTGTSVQSAAAALKAAGAASVTGLCIARWLSWDRDSDIPLLKKVTVAPYDPFACFVGTRQCRLRHT
ncbi:phosphoribosyltransferase family protein [Mycobacterium sp. 1274756.6]|uniref:phosphoribosyltransferase family protein n=1 Tax=Mycobacterium sp. 1274756.6 TaxID=1834076 RepID=UPI0008006DAC|nr:phosphoribosyltransferase family protein [Mycobacterium sp. 1274756.6]OBJ71457.1 amidophosphoribosyltransferase [Mycobacterium sp. 1274756.6]